MKFSSKMDDLTLILFILTIFFFPLFIFALIHVLMMNYYVNKDEIKINGLLKNLSINYQDLVSVNLKNYSSSIISEDFKALESALGNKGVIIEYLDSGEKKTIYISPQAPQKFIDEVNKYFKNNSENPAQQEKELVIPEVIE